MNNLIKLIIVSALAWYGFGVAVNYGGIWQSQAAPRAVDVTFANHKAMHGDLHYDWSGQAVLIDKDGKEVRFGADALEMMSSAVPEDHNFEFFSNWREFVPVYVVFLVWLFFALSIVKKINK
jgi:hypothetical protein